MQLVHHFQTGSGERMWFATEKNRQSKGTGGHYAGASGLAFHIYQLNRLTGKDSDNKKVKKQKGDNVG